MRYGVLNCGGKYPYFGAIENEGKRHRAGRLVA